MSILYVLVLRDEIYYCGRDVLQNKMSGQDETREHTEQSDAMVVGANQVATTQDCNGYDGDDVDTEVFVVFESV